MYIRCITPQCAKYKRVSIVIQLFSTERSFQKELCTAYIFLLSDNQRTYTHSELQIVIFGLEKGIQLWLYRYDFFEIDNLVNAYHNYIIQNNGHFYDIQYFYPTSISEKIHISVILTTTSKRYGKEKFPFSLEGFSASYFLESIERLCLTEQCLYQCGHLNCSN